jgi:hypothetical protein
MRCVGTAARFAFALAVATSKVSAADNLVIHAKRPSSWEILQCNIYRQPISRW